MKKIIAQMLMIVTGSFLLISSASAQNNSTEKADKITSLNGTTKEGKILAFVDEKIRFTHTGETLNYEFPKKEIEKIEYASGRTEMVTEKKVIEVSPVQVISKKRVAVIPMQYIVNGSDGKSEEMSFYLQDIAAGYLSRSAVELKLVDTREVNAVLLKRGIIDSNIRKYTPVELAALLHVEYVVMGTVLQDDKGPVTNIAGNKRRSINIHDNREYNGRYNYQETIVTNQRTETRVSLSIYNETGEKIYDKSRQSILYDKDAYKNAIHYMLKRAPLYKK